MKEDLTNDICLAAEPESREYTIWDNRIPGLGFRVRPSGSRTWVFKFYYRGRQHKKTLGRFPGMTIHQARKSAGLERSQITGGNWHPTARKTCKDLFNDFMEKHSKPHKKSWRDDEIRINKRLSGWDNQLASSISQADVTRLHQEIGKDKPYEANRVLALLKKMFNLAGQWNWFPPDWRNPCNGVKKFKEHRRDVWVTPDKMPALVAAVAAEDSVYVKAGIFLYLLTGLRKMELLRARWRDLDKERALLTIPDTKAGRPFYAPLSPPALDLFERIPALPACPWIFPGPAPQKHLADFPRRAWNRIRCAAEMPELRIHDLRRTFGSWLTTSGENLAAVAKALNQSTLSITQTYAHLAHDPVKAAIVGHGEKMRAVLNEEEL